MRLTAASDSTSASSVGMMIQKRLRFSACPIARRSRSPKSEGADVALGAATGFAAGAAASAVSTGAPLPERQNGIRIAKLLRTLTTPLQRGRLHSIKVAAGLISAQPAAAMPIEPACGHALLSMKVLNRTQYLSGSSDARPARRSRLYAGRAC